MHCMTELFWSWNAKPKGFIYQKQRNNAVMWKESHQMLVYFWKYIHLESGELTFGRFPAAVPDALMLNPVLSTAEWTEVIETVITFWELLCYFSTINFFIRTNFI